ncbi:MAG: hypothetical protein IM574_00170 [Cytophagales bacterium]|nr:hypothetical protein [Cytophagales bacterium]
MKNGKGVAGILLRDTASTIRLQKSIQQLQQVTNRALEVTSDIKAVTEKMKTGKGATGVLLSDTAFAKDLKRTMKNIEIASDRFNENMEAMKHNFLFRGYFKKQEKELKKAREDSMAMTFKKIK